MMAMKDAQPGTIHLKDYEAPRYLIDKTVLRVDITDNDASVHTTLSMRRNPDSAYQGQSLELYGQQLTLKSVSIDGRALTIDEYSMTSEDLLIHQVPDQF